MPSKIQHEIDKLRGILTSTSRLYTDSIASLSEKVTIIKENIFTINSKQDILNNKINSNTKKAQTALKQGRSFLTQKKSYYMSVPISFTGSVSNFGVLLDPDADESVSYPFVLPSDFISFKNLYIHYKGSATGSFVLDIRTYYASIGEAEDEHTENDLTNIITPPDDKIYRFKTAGLLQALKKGDTGSIYIKRDADHVSDTDFLDVTIMKVEFEYISET